ncbi:EAL domain-containing protein [Brucellaceae bacterium D45D]
MSAYAYPVPCLILEISSQRHLNHIRLCRRGLSEAQALGCKIAIRDFGASFISFQRLSSLCVDIIKIGATILWAARQDSRAAESLRHVVAYAAYFSGTVVLQGVENNHDVASACTSSGNHFQRHFYLPAPFT